MDYCNPASVVSALIEAGKRKASLSVADILVRGAISGAILAIATELAITAAIQTGLPLVGALIFPAGFVMIVLLNLELLTGSFAVMPMAQMDGAVHFSDTLRNWGWSFLGNLAGSLIFAFMVWGTLTMFGTTPAGAVGDRIAAIADAKTLAFAAHGGAGWAAAFTKAMLCNWMVCMGVVMGAVAQSTISKIVAAWIPICVFFGLGYEHAVVNMFVIPAGMMLGAKTTAESWWLWNQIPVTLGNLCGGMLFTGLALYATFRVRHATPSLTVLDAA
ncbi:MAG TPA: formate/nitrite transporter family protein, partial [Steroidobacteraceae bacterium]